MSTDVVPAATLQGGHMARFCSVVLSSSIASVAVVTSAPAAAPPVAWTLRSSDFQFCNISPGPDGGFYISASDTAGNTEVIRYDAAGTKQWLNEYGPTYPTQIHTDGSGSALVSGQ